MKHRLNAQGADAVTGEYSTRCGLKSLPLPGGYFSKFEVANTELDVNCPKCRVRLGPTESKVLRALHDAGGEATLLGSHRFERSTERAAVWAPKIVRDKLVMKGFVRMTGKTAALRASAKSLAASLPEIVE